MNAIIEYIQRFLLDGHSNPTKLINIVTLRMLLEELESKVRADINIEELKELHRESQPTIHETLRRIQENNINRVSRYPIQLW